MTHGAMGMYDAVLNAVKDRPKTESEIRSVVRVVPSEESLFTAVLRGLQREYRIIYNTSTEEYSYNPKVARTITQSKEGIDEEGNSKMRCLR